MNKDAINFLVHVFRWACVVKKKNCWVNGYVCLQLIQNCFPKCYSNLHSYPIVSVSSWCYRTLQYLVVEYFLTVLLICISLKTDEVEYLFICLVILISSLGDVFYSFSFFRHAVFSLSVKRWSKSLKIQFWWEDGETHIPKV